MKPKTISNTVITITQVAHPMQGWFKDTLRLTKAYFKAGVITIPFAILAGLIDRGPRGTRHIGMWVAVPLALLTIFVLRTKLGFVAQPEQRAPERQEGKS